MAQVYTFTDSNGEVRLMAEINPAPGGGYTPPTARSTITGNAVSVGNGSADFLTWDTDFGPDTLLDLTTPAAPTVVTAGIYSFTAVASPNVDLTIGGQWRLGLDVDANGQDAFGSTPSPAATAAIPRPRITVAVTFYCPAGALITAGALNNDGVASRTFKLESCNVQRIT